MERRINKRLDGYITTFKDSIRDKATALGITQNEQMSSLLQHIYDYDRFALSKEDFMKRKRVKNVVPFLFLNIEYFLSSVILYTPSE